MCYSDCSVMAGGPGWRGYVMYLGMYSVLRTEYAHTSSLSRSLARNRPWSGASNSVRGRLVAKPVWPPDLRASFPLGCTRTNQQPRTQLSPDTHVESCSQQMAGGHRVFAPAIWLVRSAGRDYHPLSRVCISACLPTDTSWQRASAVQLDPRHPTPPPPCSCMHVMAGQRASQGQLAAGCLEALLSRFRSCFPAVVALLRRLRLVVLPLLLLLLLLLLLDRLLAEHLAGRHESAHSASTSPTAANVLKRGERGRERGDIQAGVPAAQAAHGLGLHACHA